MSETKHTPGPWSQETRSDSGGGERPVVVAGGSLVAAVSRDNGSANAHIIAAAPEMLTALKAIDALLTDRYDEFRCPANEEARREVRAAISKAEGRS